MAKRKTIQEIKKGVLQLITDARTGSLKQKTVQYNCGDALIVAVNNGSGLAKWYARVGGKTILLGDYNKMEYKTASANVVKLKEELQSHRTKTSQTVISKFPE